MQWDHYISPKPDSTFCYDGNNKDNDGWSSHWHIEFGWACSGGNADVANPIDDACLFIWGSHTYVSDPKNYWIDSNTIDGDGWDSNWNIESGWMWNKNSSNDAYSWNEKCGDGKRFNNNCSYWDDGDSKNNDGWNSNWEVERGWIWKGGDLNNRDSCSEIWGDGWRFNSNITYCDDGNTSSNDGWDSSWKIETGWKWVGGNTNTRDTWTMICEYWKQIDLNSYWYDGNNKNGDGWSAKWKQETGWNWINGGGYPNKDTCTEIWGDGMKFNLKINYCDDGNTTNGDGWTSSWSIEAGWTWTGGNSKTKDSWTDLCGDGKVVVSKSNYWDDGNTNGGDGCSSTWSVELGWKCLGGSSSANDIWSETWGDGIRFNSNLTYCDDGNDSNGDGCNSVWTIESGWNCFGGNSTTHDTWLDICGDGKKYTSDPSFWDDGNTSNSDGWNSTWLIEKGWKCSGGNSTCKDTWIEIWGDGIKFNSKTTYWDDGNTKDGDGWNSICIIESNWRWSWGDSEHKDIWQETFNQGISVRNKHKL